VEAFQLNLETGRKMQAITNYFTSYSNADLSVSDVYRAKILMSASLTCGLLLFPFMLVWGVWSNFSGLQFILLSLLICTLFTTPYVFNYTKSIQKSGIYVNCVSTVILVIFTFFDGGLYSTAIPWFPVLPLFAVFFSGKKYGLTIAAVLILDLFALLAMHVVDFLPPAQIDGIALLVFYSGSTLSAVVLLLVLAFNYLAWQDAVGAEVYQANKVKGEFLSGMSHELRTPLHSILGFAEILKHQYIGKLNDKQDEFVGHIQTSGEHLLQLVDNLLDITKIEAGIVEFNPAPASIHEIVNDSVTMMSESAAKKNVKLNYSYKKIPEQLLLLDQLKIKQVILNLLSNAIKFTPAGGDVSIVVTVDSQLLAIGVEDSGPGIPHIHKKAVFERFFKINHENSNKDPGSGLGLAISKHFVEMHGGTIELNDATEASTGAIFTCCIPVHCPTST
jgi:signal transduction histidine kinase